MATRQNACCYDEVASGAIIYSYVRGNPLKWIDPLGLEVRIYSSDAFGIPGLNHAYVYSTETGTGRGRDTTDPNGNGVRGLDNPYVVVNLPPGMSERDFMKKVINSPKFNKGTWIPWKNDCHSDLNAAFDEAGVRYPGAPNGRIDIDDVFSSVYKNIGDVIFILKR